MSALDKLCLDGRTNERTNGHQPFLSSCRSQKLSKTDIKTLTEDKTEPDINKKMDANTVSTKSKTFKQKLKNYKKKKELTKLEQSIEHHLNSIEMKEDDYEDDEEDDEGDAEDDDEGDFL